MHMHVCYSWERFYPRCLLGATGVWLLWVTVTSYCDGGSCVVVNGKLDEPAMKRLLEFAQTHDVLAAKCTGQYLPVQALLKPPPIDLSPLSLNTRREISDLLMR